MATSVSPRSNAALAFVSVSSPSDRNFWNSTSLSALTWSGQPRGRPACPGPALPRPGGPPPSAGPPRGALVHQVREAGPAGPAGAGRGLSSLSTPRASSYCFRLHASTAAWNEAAASFCLLDGLLGVDLAEQRPGPRSSPRTRRCAPGRRAGGPSRCRRCGVRSSPGRAVACRSGRRPAFPPGSRPRAGRPGSSDEPGRPARAGPAGSPGSAGPAASHRGRPAAGRRRPRPPGAGSARRAASAGAADGGGVGAGATVGRHRAGRRRHLRHHRGHQPAAAPGRSARPGRPPTPARSRAATRPG